MKKYLYIFISLVTSLNFISLTAIETLSEEELRNAITPSGSSDVIRSTATGEWLLDAVLEFIRDSVFRLLLLIAVGMFLYIGWKLLIARWNPEELKKALTSFVYAWIGLFVVAAAYALVTFIAWIDIL